MKHLSYTHTRTREARARACVFYFMNYISLVRQRHPCRCYLNILLKYSFYLAQLDGCAVCKERSDRRVPKILQIIYTFFILSIDLYYFI